MKKIIIILIVVLVVIGVGGFIAFEVYMNSLAPIPSTQNNGSIGGTGSINTGSSGATSGAINNATSSSTGSSGTSTTTGTGTLPGSTTTTTITTSDGSLVQARNIKDDPALVKDPANPGYYYLGYHTGTDPSATANPPYIIEYIERTQYFNIALLREPLAATRLDMEHYLMQHLGITATQMCSLKYMVSVPYSVNQEFAGADLKFSSCAGAVAL